MNYKPPIDRSNCCHYTRYSLPKTPLVQYISSNILKFPQYPDQRARAIRSNWISSRTPTWTVSNQLDHVLISFWLSSSAHAAQWTALKRLLSQCLQGSSRSWSTTDPHLWYILVTEMSPVVVHKCRGNQWIPRPNVFSQKISNHITRSLNILTENYLKILRQPETKPLKGCPKWFSRKSNANAEAFSCLHAHGGCYGCLKLV